MALDTLGFTLQLPSARGGGRLDQDEEWCELEIDGERRRIRFHDYADIYDVPGLYEHLFAELLECSSPHIVCDLLSSELRDEGVDLGSLAALDFGAGNGMVADCLAAAGIDSIVGADLLPEARDAALRDRPGLYDDYLAVDITELTTRERATLEAHEFDVMTCVAALGFDDIPPVAFATAFNLVSSPGWVAFNLRERFAEDTDPGGFGSLIRRMLDAGIVEERARVAYPHRKSVAGEPLTYVALIVAKCDDVPLSWAR